MARSNFPNVLSCASSGCWALMQNVGFAFEAESYSGEAIVAVPGTMMFPARQNHIGTHGRFVSGARTSFRSFRFHTCETTDESRNA